MHREVSFTDDTDVFVRGHNRPVDKGRSAKIAQDIMSRKNLLHAYPIVVSEDLTVIDGDHRLEAARIAGVGVHYIVVNDVTADDQARSNSLAKSWSNYDWAHYWAGREDNPRHKEYAKVLSIASAFDGVPFSAVVAFSQWGKYNRRALIGVFKDGRYVCVSENDCRVLCQMYMDLVERGMPKGNPLQGTVALLYANPQYDHDRMLSKLDRWGYKLEPRTNGEDNVAMLQEIYNFGSRGDHRVHLMEA